MRKNRAPKRPVTPDAKYNSELLSRLINMVMQDGKKSTAQAVVYKALATVTSKIKDSDAIEVFFGAVENIKPQVMVKSRRVGGANYQVPVEVAPDRQVSLAMRWMITFAQNKKGKPMDQALASEIIDAFNNTGSAVKKKDEVHRMAAANKAFAHYRW
ncbi:30S ribosomal protein S7 [Lentisphaera araneosa HTCC2155]|jgi:small subunit ribosomal protein S7|uniref:Small ribosomal subunit protein uS7 n=1 Tax=Lentisphaera araneosa HTCC2155 TaxID=313628 RepID=A6DPN0_9BACT|nr:30S ribosomal protein S7 [Lentisphaera araneosa]EDM26325.1 30S ribosomal protein S7 [Lentisphaera araneosa HTCC2155]